MNVTRVVDDAVRRSSPFWGEHGLAFLIETEAGGLHLTSATADYLQRVGEVLVETESVQRVYPNHCTGEAAFDTLTLTLGPCVVRPCPAGTVVESRVW